MATYYVSFATGDDTRTALQAQNKSTPWKHHPDSNLASGASAAIKGSLAAGDIIVMSRGERWDGTKLTSSKAGTSGSPIITTCADDFGVDGDLPLISAATVVTGWTATGVNGEYKATLATQTYVVFVGDVELTSGTPGSLPNNGFGWVAGELYLKIGENPSGLSVFAATSYALWVANNYREYHDIDFQYSNDGTAGVVYTTTSGLLGLRLHSCLFSRARQNIIRLYNTVGAIIDGCGITAREKIALGSGFTVLSGNGSSGTIVSGCDIDAKVSSNVYFAGNGGEIIGNTLTGKGTGVQLDGTGSVVRSNTLQHWNSIEYGAGGQGADVILNAAAADNIIARNNFSNGYHNIIARETSGNGNNKIIGNIFNRPHVNGIALGTGGTTVHPDMVAGNTFIHRPTAGNPVGSVGHAVVFGSAETRVFECKHAKVICNLFVGETSGADMVSFDSGLDIYPSSMSKIELDYNCYWQRNAGAQWRNPVGNTNTTDFATWKTNLAAVSVTGAEAHGISVLSSGNSPVIDIDADNFRLRKGSPCIRAGVDVGLTADADGNTIPTGAGFDIGPYFYKPEVDSGFSPWCKCDSALPLSAQPCKSHALPFGTHKITVFPGVATAAQINEAAKVTETQPASIGDVDQFIATGIGTVTITLEMIYARTSLPINTKYYPLGNQFISFENTGTTGRFSVSTESTSATYDRNWATGELITLKIDSDGYDMIVGEE